MFKWIRRLIGMMIVLFILLVILLVPGSIPEGEQLRNVQAGSSLIELAQNAVSNASVSTEGLSTELSLNSALDNSDFQKMALGMDGNDLHVKVPVSLGPVESYLDLTMTGQVENNVMNLTVTAAKLGKIPIPKSLVLNYLKDQSNQNGGGFTVNGDQITLEIPQTGYTISKARVENGNAKVTVSISLF